MKTDRLKGLMRSKNMPFVDIVFPLTNLLMLASSLAMIFNFYAHVGALYLIVFMILATYYFADFWSVKGTDRDMRLNQFTLNLTVIGGLLFFVLRS
jgi:putative oxidoreductase